MAKFRGIPNAAYQFDSSCQGVLLTYTKELCQKALVDLIYSSNLEAVKAKYGEKVIGCFTQNDLQKFHTN